MDKALKWIETANEKSFARYGNKRKIIVRIDVDYLKTNYPEIADSAYDLTNDFNRDRFLKWVKERRFSCAYNEVVFLDRIPSEAVSIEYIHGKGFVDRNKPVSSRIQRHKQVTSNIYSGFDDLNYSPDTERKNVSNNILYSTQSTSVPSKFPNTAYSQPAINVPRTIETTANPSVTSPSLDYNLPPRENIDNSQDTEVKNLSNIDLFPTDSTSVPSKITNTAYSQPAINVPRTIQTTANPSVISPSLDYNLPPRENIDNSQDTEVKNLSNIDLFPTDSTSVPSKITNTAYSQPAINVPRTIQTTANPSVISPSLDYNLPPRENIDNSQDTEVNNVSNIDLFPTDSTSVPSKITNTAYSQPAINVPRTIQTTANPSVISPSLDYNLPPRENIDNSQDTEVNNVSNIDLFPTDSTSVPSKITNTAYSQPAINVPRTIQTTANPSVISPSLDYNLPPRENIDNSQDTEVKNLSNIDLFPTDSTSVPSKITNTAYSQPTINVPRTIQTTANPSVTSPSLDYNLPPRENIDSSQDTEVKNLSNIDLFPTDSTSVPSKITNAAYSQPAINVPRTIQTAKPSVTTPSFDYNLPPREIIKSSVKVEQSYASPRYIKPSEKYKDLNISPPGFYSSTVKIYSQRNTIYPGIPYY